MKKELFYRYRVAYNREITKECCTKETDSSIWFIKNGKEIREKKDQHHLSWHITREGAIQYIIDSYDKSIIAAKSNMEYFIEQKQKFKYENS